MPDWLAGLNDSSGMDSFYTTNHSLNFILFRLFFEAETFEVKLYKKSINSEYTLYCEKYRKSFYTSVSRLGSQS